MSCNKAGKARNCPPATRKAYILPVKMAGRGTLKITPTGALAAAPRARFSTAMLPHEIERAIERLQDVERRIVRLMWGAGGEAPRTAAETAAKIGRGMTAQQVETIEQEVSTSLSGAVSEELVAKVRDRAAANR